MNLWNKYTVYENEQDRQVARIISTLIWASWGVYLLVIISGIMSKDWNLIAVTLFGGALLIVPMVLLRRRHLRSSSLAIVLIVLATVTLIATVGQGIRDTAIVAFPMVFIFAGLTMNRAIFRLCVGLALVAVAWLVFGEMNGWFIPVPSPEDLSMYLIVVTLILVVTALAVDLLATNMRHNLELARIKVEQSLLAEETMRESEQRYKFLATNIPDIIYSLDGEGKIVAVNSSAFERYGYTEQNAKGKAFLDFVHPEDQEILINSFLKALEDKREITTGLKLRIVAENGTSYWFELHARARFDRDGSYLGEEGVLRDITDRRQMEAELLRTQKLESLGVLAGGIAHDFNNLMAVVHGYIGLALTDLPADHDASQKLLKALRSVAQTKDLTGKLITFSSGGKDCSGKRRTSAL